MRSSRAFIPWFLYHVMAKCPSENLPLPDLYAGGRFYYPNGTPQCVTEGSQMNVSWTTDYSSTNLYLVQGTDFNNPVGILLNTASTWHEWTVGSDSPNQTAPFVFRIVDAHGSSQVQQTGGFLSGRFYIDFNAPPSSTTTASATATSTQSNTASAFVSPSATSTVTESTADSSTASVTATPTTTTGAAGSQDGGNEPHNNVLALGLGIGLGVPFCIAVGAAIFFARRRRIKHSPAPPIYDYQPNTDHYPEKPPAELSGKNAGQDTQQLYGDSRWIRPPRSDQPQIRYELG